MTLLGKIFHYSKIFGYSKILFRYSKFFFSLQILTIIFFLFRFTFALKEHRFSVGNEGTDDSPDDACDFEEKNTFDTAAG